MARPLNGPSRVTEDFGLVDDIGERSGYSRAYLRQRFSGDQGVLVVTKPTLYVLVALYDLLRALWVAHRLVDVVVLHLAADHNVVRRR